MPGQADRASVLHLSDHGRLLPLIPLIHSASAGLLLLEKVIYFLITKDDGPEQKKGSP